MSLPNNTSSSIWDFNLQVAAGKVRGVTFVNIFAFNPNVSSTLVHEDVWEEGGVLQFLSSAETITCESDDAEDTSGSGNGAHTLLLSGVDNNYNPITEILTMEGVTPVITKNSFLRVNQMSVIKSGSEDFNVGTIVATATTSATTQAIISPLTSNTLKSQFTIPKGITGFIKNLTVSTDNNDQFSILPQGRAIDYGTWKSLYKVNINEQAYYQEFSIPIKIKSKSDIRIQGIKTGGGDASITTNLEMYLVDNKLI